jgi:hypothetical protein
VNEHVSSLIDSHGVNCHRVRGRTWCPLGESVESATRHIRTSTTTLKNLSKATIGFIMQTDQYKQQHHSSLGDDDDILLANFLLGIAIGPAGSNTDHHVVNAATNLDGTDLYHNRTAVVVSVVGIEAGYKDSFP